VDSNLTGTGTGNNFVPANTFVRKDTVVVHIPVVDQNNTSLSGATVNLTVRRPNGNAHCRLTVTTDASGIAEGTCKIPGGMQSIGTWDVHVISVTKTGYIYDAGGSVTDHNFTVQ
jgi:uncharacterized protein YfaS (alpha-2-macroglobulin family)